MLQAHHIIRWPWFTAFLLANIVMLTATIAGAVYGALLRGPELIGYCSSLTRDTPYVRGGYTKSTLQGLERSKFYAKTRLRLVDVESDKEIGLLAIANDDGDAGNLRQGRLYK
jgi:hypothetical protein